MAAARLHTLERTHLARNDLDWLPPSMKAVRWMVAGSTWTLIAGGLLGSALFARSAIVLYAKAIAAVLAGGYYLGDRVARAVTRRRLDRLAHGSIEIARLRGAADGVLLHVRGRVRARGSISALLSGSPAVYRRVTFVVGGVRAIHEAAVDFGIVDAAGELVAVAVEGSRLLAPDVPRAPVTEQVAAALLDGSPEALLPLFAKRRARTGAIEAGEFLVRDGDQVEIVGFKTRMVDPSVEERLPREAPMRATLRSGKELPLLISPARP